MSNLEFLVRGYFIEQELPDGGPSGQFRLIKGVAEGEDGRPVVAFTNELYYGHEAVRLATAFRKHGAKPFEI